MERFLCLLKHSIALKYMFTVICECPSLFNYKVKCPSVSREEVLEEAMPTFTDLLHHLRNCREVGPLYDQSDALLV